MSFITRSARVISNASKQCIAQVGVFTEAQCSIRPLTRSLFMLSTPSRMNSNKHACKPSNLCSCGCGIHGMHTKGDRELVEFLQDEIVAEKKSQPGVVPSHIDDFTVKQNKAELILSKTFHDEQITVSLNVNHTVSSESAADLSPQGGQEEEGILTSRPDFEVDIKVGSKVMSFTCQYTSPGDITEGDQAEDAFGISELTTYDGEWEEKVYCASGDILDGSLYDLLMNYLDERGITNEFAEKLSGICTNYEHSLYINLLENIQSLVKRK